MSSGSSEEQRRRRRRLADELEEGECAPGGYQSSSDTEDYYNRDAALSGGESDETVSDDLDATASSAATVATASSVLAELYGRGGAYSVPANRYRPFFASASHFGRGLSHASSAAAAAAAPGFPCRVCGKEFASKKAVCGHMKVHALEALHGGVNYKGNGIIRDNKVEKKKKNKKSNVEVAAGWGVTGRRGCSGLGMSTGTAKDSLKTESDHSMDSVPAEPQLITPISYAMPEKSSFAMPDKPSSASMASARTSLSDESSGKKPMTQHNDGMDIASGKKPMTQHNDGMDIAVAAEAGSDTPNNPIPPAEPVVVHQQEEPAPPPPPPPAGQKQARRRARRDPAAPAGQQRPDGYECRVPTCGMRFSTHQALGGHAAAHRNRLRAAAAAAAGVHQGGAAPAGKPQERLHPCKKCSAVFSTGVQLGGHMRKHWEGEPIKPNKKPRLIQALPPPADVTPGPEVFATDLTLALPIKEESQSIAPAVDAEQPVPTAAAEGTPEPVVPGPRAKDRPVILFGVDIGVKTPPAKEGSPASKDPSSASTGGDQQ